MSTPTAPATGSAESRQISRQNVGTEKPEPGTPRTDAALRTLADNQAEEIERLLADKARIDWLEQNMWHIWTNVRARSAVPRFVAKSFCGIFFAKTVRAAIDAARKEGQP